MSSLDPLKVNECPAAFLELAAKHNALVDLVSQFIGTAPLKVKVSSRNAVISLDQNALETSLESFIYDTATFAAADAVANYVPISAFATYFNNQFANVTVQSNYDVCQNGSPVSVTFFTKP